MMDVHDSIEQLQKELGYIVSPIGSCQGFSLRWLEASLLREESIFDARIHKIVNQLDTLAETISNVQAKPVNELTEEDMQLLEIPAFYVSLGLYQMPEEYSSLFLGACFQVEVTRISAIAASEKIRSLGGLDEIGSDIYSIEDFKVYLDTFEQLAKQSGLSSADTIGLLLYSVDHTNALTYIPGEGWKFMDINLYPSRAFPVGSTSELISTIQESFVLDFETNALAIQATVFTVGLKKDKNQLFKELLGSLITDHSKTRVLPEPEHAIYMAELAAAYGDAELITHLYSKTSINTKNAKGVTMHYLAAQNGHANVIDALGLLGIDLDEANPDGATAVFIAAARNRGLVIERLAYYKANLNVFYNQKTAIYAAAYLGNLEAVNALAEGGAALDLVLSEDIAPPIIVAVENRHTKVLASLIHYGADLNIKYNGVTPLFLAAIMGNTEIVQELIKNNKTELDISCLDSIAELHIIVGDKEDEATLRMTTFLKKQSNLRSINVTASDIALMKGYDEIAKLIEQERDKRTNQKLLSSQNSVSFFEDQDSSSTKWNPQHQQDAKAHRYLKEDRDSSGNVSPNP